ncbi:MAG: hypothetical protein GY750_03140 [Lentisphaerae bacterium]|nr:hypothetical protein [Lentisphaerota bacterium]MCP4100413.1 hypothetical protein [Lentisphaerota bacterium]
MKLFYFAVLSMISVVIFSGCNSIPPGEAPKGNITNPEVTKDNLSWKAATNYMTTAFTSFCLQEYPGGCEFQPDFQSDDSTMNLWPLKVLSQTQNSIPIKAVNKADVNYYLISRIYHKPVLTWEMRFVRIKDNQPLWSESVSINQDK